MPQDLGTTLDLLRHGEVEGGRIYRGQLDHPLSSVGWQQMRRAVSGKRPWQSIISSPLLRCSEFANELAEESGIPLVKDDRLLEIGFGVWQGLSRDVIRAQQSDRLRQFYRDPIRHRPEDAEPLEEFQARVSDCISALLRDYSNQHLLVVCHAGVTRAAMGYALSLPLPSLYRLSIDNASFTRLRATDERPLSVMFQNKTML